MFVLGILRLLPVDLIQRHYSFEIHRCTRYTVHGRGAKSPLGSNYQVTTTSKKFTILSKKCPKSGPKPDQTLIDFPNGTNTSAWFEQFFSKLVSLLFQIYTVQFHLSTPHMPLLKITKNLYEQTNERDIQFSTGPRT